MKWKKNFFSALLLLLLWYFRTWFHGLVMLFYKNPVIIEVVLLTLIIHYGILKRSTNLARPRPIINDASKQTVGYTNYAFWLSLLIFIALLIPGIFLAQFASGVHIAGNIEYRLRDTLPESTLGLRLMPYSVAERYAKDSLQLSQYKLGTENISIVNDRLHWTFPLKPDGLIITFTKQNRGVVAVDATTQARNTTHFMVDLAIGEGMQLRDNLYWNIWKNRYFVDTDDPFYIITDNGEEILTVVGAINYSFHFRWGVFYTVPNFAGVFVIDSAGKIEFLSPEEALEHPDLAGNRIFPENLARIYVDAYQYHLGLANKLFIHEDQIKIQDAPNVDSTVNKQPYLMETVEGLKWFISAEPYGASHGIFKLFLVDARTGEIEIYELPPTETLTGPVRAIDYVRRANPVVSWDRFDSVEPLPFIRDQVLYWKLTVIPTDAAGIAYQVFINSETNDIVELTSDEEVIAFLHGKYEEKVRQSEELKSDDEIIASIKAKIRELEELLEQLGN